MITLVMVAALQDVEALLARIDEKDPQKAWAAIDALLASPDKAAVERGAARLPAFYRDALLSELKQPPARDLRVTLKARDSALDELKRQAGLGVDATSQRGRIATIDAVGVRPIDALLRLCDKMEAGPSMDAVTGLVRLESREMRAGALAFRNFGACVRYVTMTKEADFTNPAPWVAVLDLSLLWDPGITVVDVKPAIRLIEAKTDAGAALKLSKPRSVPAFESFEWREPWRDRSSGVSVRLDLPEAEPQRVTRLRFAATLVVAGTQREYVLSQDKRAAGDDEFEVALVEHGAGGAKFRVRPKKLRPADLAVLPLGFDFTYQHRGAGWASFAAHVVGDAVEYPVSWTPHVQQSGFGVKEPQFEQVRVLIPQKLMERPLYVEFTDIPLR